MADGHRGSGHGLDRVAAGQQEIAGALNDTVVDLPPRSLPELIHQQVLATPEATAVSCGDELTYARLWEQAGLVAGRLRAEGIGPGDLVGVAMERGTALVVALLGVLRSGAGYVPLDPDLPPARLARTVGHAGLRTVLTDGERPEWLPSDGVVVLRLGEAEPTAGPGPATFSAPDPSSVAYVIYTSGSTGLPKGVAVPHSALANFMCSMREAPGLDASDVLVAVTTVSFDIAALELFLPLVVGGRVVVASRAQATDPALLADLITEAGGTVLQATPATWQLLREADWRPPQGFTVLCGGDRLPPDLAGWLTSLGSAAWDLYGPTETTIWSAAGRLGDRGRTVDWSPVANTSVHVLDTDMRPVPFGEQGEVYIGGAGLALGYMGQPALTAERFLPDRLSPVPGQRLYATGDLGRRRDDGTVEILGRADHQLKVRGFRVEPGEIEAAILGHPQVRQAVVVPRREEGRDQGLVAYVVPAPADDSGTVPDAAGRHAADGERGDGPPVVGVDPAGLSGADQLRSAIDAALDRVAPGGQVIIEGVRDLRLLTAEAVVAEVSRRSPYDSCASLAGQVDQILTLTDELAVDPRFFAEVQRLSDRVARVDIHPDPGTETEREGPFRYRVVIHRTADAVATAADRPSRRTHRDFAGTTMSSLEAMLRSAPGDFALRGVPDARRAFAVAVAERLSRADHGEVLGGLLEAARDCDRVRTALDRQAVQALAERLGFHVTEVLCGDGGPDESDLLLRRAGTSDRPAPARVEPRGAPAPAPAPDELRGMVNDPARARRLRRLDRALRSFLTDRLPAYMVPGEFVVVEGLPLNANGKIDRTRLPLPLSSAGRRPSAPPVSEDQRLVARLWGEVLGHDDIGLDDTFLNVGGDSVRAVRVASLARRAGLDMPVADVLRLPLKQLAELVAPGPDSPGASSAVRAADEPAEAGVPGSPYPLTSTQAGMLFHSQYSAGTADYFQQTVYRIHGPVDTDALRTAWETVARRHSVLRNVAEWEGLAAPHQRTLPDAVPPLRVVELLGVDDREAALNRFLEEDRATGFDIASEPPFRLTLMRWSHELTEMILSYHHLLLDGWSLPILVNEVERFYAARPDGEPPLPAPAPSYRRYVEWLRDQDHEAALTYWRERLSGFTAPTPIALGRPDSTAGDTTGEVTITLRGDLARRLELVGRASGLTLGSVFHGAWALLLSRYSGEDDVVFGSTVAVRPATLPGADELVGLCINTVPVRCRTAPQAALDGWLRDLQERMVEGRSYDYAALADVQAASEVPRGTSLFDSLVVVDGFAAPSGTLPSDSELRIEPVGTVESTGYPLVVMLEAGDRPTIRLRYRRSRFDHAAVSALAGHLHTVMRAYADNPSRQLADICLLAPHEWSEVVAGWNRTRAPYPADMTLPGLFTRQAAATPHAVALRFGDAAWTYEQLNQRANRLAHCLRARGAGLETLVGVLTTRTPDMVVAMLAVMKAGGAYVPLASDNPPERLAHVVRDAGLPLVIAHAGLVGGLDLGSAELCVLDTMEEELDLSPSGDPAELASPDSLAYVMYTSGSSGRPKGVMCHHRGLVNYIHWCSRHYADLSDGGAPVFSSFGFDMIVPNLYVPLILGHPVHLIPETRDPERLADLLLAQSPFGFVKLTPGHLELLSQRVSPEQARGLAAVLAVGADGFPASVLESWRALDPDTRVINEYGPTEASVANSVHVVSGSPAGDLVPIGRPISNTTLYVLDEGMNPLPVGVPGEIYIGGVCCARGYRNHPGRTAQQFVPDPFSDQPGGRLYRTGDVGYWHPDGNLQFVGRRDHQVKIRGYRIETGEVEAALAAHPRVRHAVVSAPPGASGRRRLVAHAVADPGAQVGRQELRDWLTERLPPYMLPSVIVLLDAMPLDSNGKVDRKALAVLSAADTREDAPSRGPAGPLEERIAAIWQRVLGVDELGAHDNFFALGGDSILTMQIAAEARRAGLRITPKDIFLYPTVVSLAPHVTPDSPSEVAAATEIVDATGPLRLTPVQQWFLDQDLTDAHHYNQSVQLELDSPDPVALESALRAVIDRHDALRLRFTRSPDGWHQTVVPSEDSFRLRVVTATDRDGRQGPLDDEADQLQASLDVARGPLVAAALFGLGDDRPSRLLITVHHLAVDTLSWRSILVDLAESYEAALRGEPWSPPAPPTTFSHWTRSLGRYADEVAPALDQAYWIGMLTDIPRLPRDFPGGRHTVRRTGTVTARLSSEDTAALTGIPASGRMRVDEVLLTALAMTLQEWVGEAVPVDVERHGREHPVTGVDVGETVGWFTCVHPVRLPVPLTGETGRDTAAAVTTVRQLLRSVPGDGFAYGILRHLTTGPRYQKLRELPDSPILFNYQGQMDRSHVSRGPLRVLPGTLGAERSPDQRRSHDIEIEAAVKDGVLETEWIFSGDRFRTGTIREVAETFTRRLSEVIRHCDGNRNIFTPSDFRPAGMSQRTLDALVAAHPGIEDVFPLTPVQQGMLYHSLLHPDSAHYQDQQELRLTGRIDVDAFRGAWGDVSARHPLLRGAVVWRGVPQPVHVVRTGNDISTRVFDWRGEAPEDMGHNLRTLASAERAEPFAADGTAPIRLALVRVSSDQLIAFMTYHHLLLDGWSVALMLRELMECYRARLAGEVAALPPATSYRRHVEWLASRPPKDAERYWRGVFDGAVRRPMPSVAQDDPGGTGTGSVEATLGSTATEALRHLASRCEVTLGSVALAAWGIALNHLTGRQDITVGSTFAVRSPEIDGVETIVGPMINTLPLRLAIRTEGTVTELLKDVQARHLDIREYGHSALTDVNAWSGAPPRTALFDSIVVVEGYSDQLDDGSGTTLSIGEITESTGYPLTLCFKDAERLRLRLLFDRRTHSPSAASAVMAAVEGVLTDLAASPGGHRRVRDVLGAERPPMAVRATLSPSRS
ncbi:amino acid adenylation domain-containing protein [Streptomyces sp. NPDC048584]|uniref:amino acid adenylation domain-containing protein n=1 Tax=Streptomyces sp. NPDC048584 TaxID=3365573 RepID=UPI00371043D4